MRKPYGGKVSAFVARTIYPQYLILLYLIPTIISGSELLMNKGYIEPITAVVVFDVYLGILIGYSFLCLVQLWEDLIVLITWRIFRVNCF